MSSSENGCASVKESTEPNSFGLDDILVKIGQFGKFQIRFFLLLFTLVAFHAIIKYGFIFTAGTVVYRCRIPECDGSENVYERPWTEFSIPKTSSGKLQKCQRYTTFNSTTTGGQKVCNAENFNQKLEKDCGGDLIFRDEEITISNEFKLFCSDEWKLAMAGSINNLGQFVGMPIGGYFSDKYGRSMVLAVSSFTSGIIGLVRSFSPNYYMFVFLGFLDNCIGGTLYATVFVLALESLGPTVRMHACTLVPMFGGIARFLLAFVAKQVPNWRLIERYFYIPALGFIALPWILPESCRWLLSQGEEEKATKIIQKTAKTNKRKLSDSSIEKLLKSNRQILSNDKTKKSKIPFGDAFKLFPWRIINCSLCWFANIFVFMGISLNLTMLGGNKYNSFMYVSLIEIPGIMLPSLTINRYGRKLSIFGFMFLTSIFIMATTIVSSDSSYLQLTLFLLGKMLIASSFQVLYIFTSEIFPTNARNGLLSFCSMIGRLGAMVAPQTPLMAKYYASAPAVLFASSAFLSGSLVLFLPETKDITLPTTLQDAENIGKKDVNVEPEAEIEENVLMLKV